MKRSYKKGKLNHMSRRNKNKTYGGRPKLSLSDIDMYISIMDDTDKSFTELQKYADIMTIQQTYAIINHLIGGDIALKLPDELKPILQKIETRLTSFPKLVENIKIFNGLSTEYGFFNMDFLNVVYTTFPISKINPKLGTIITTNDKKSITYEQNKYTFIGKGGFGTVYVNTDPKINQAIKQVMPLGQELQEVFKNEVNNYNKISSIVCDTNYFCKFKSCFIGKNVLSQNVIYILMEYCGQNLFKTIKERAITQKLSFETLIKWFITIAKGIKCMHDNDYVHLDIKPINITIDDYDDAKLIDFGLAQNIHEIIEPFDAGTEGFMAPEMGEEDIDYKKCDIYALGITFAKCIFEYYISIFKKVDTNFKNNHMMLYFIGLDAMLADDPSDRPTIQDVITILVSFPIKNTFLRNLKTAGVSVDELINADFSLKDIFKAGYTYGNIRDIYKASNGSTSTDLKELLKHCDKTWESFPKRHKSLNCTIDTICATHSQLDDCKDRFNLENRQINLIKSMWNRMSSMKSKNRSRKSMAVVDV